MLVISDPSVDKRALVAGITGHAADPGAACAPWTIDNRYYTVEVELLLAEPGTGGEPAASHEAVVIVFDMGRQQSFASLREWWEEQGGAAEPGVKLAVATGCSGAAVGGGGGGAAAEQWVLDAQEWCAEELIEYVEVGDLGAAAAAAASGGPSGAPLQEQAGRGEAEGLQRVVEALHAHTWPGLQLKPRGSGSSQPAASRQPAPEAAEQPEANGSGPALAEPRGDVNGISAGVAAGGLPASLDVGEEQAEELDLLFAELAGGWRGGSW